VKRLVAVLVASVAALATAPAAYAAGVTYIVNDPGSATDAAALAACDTPGTAGCTLPAAITESNTSTGVADTITFSGTGTTPGPFSTGLPPTTDPVTIDGGGNTNVSFDPAAPGSLLALNSANTLVKAITFTGGGSGTVVNMGASADQLNSVTVQNTAGTGIRIGGSSSRVDGSHVANAATGGISVTGASATISSPVISGSGANGIDIAGSNAVVSSPDISGSQGDGIRVTGSGASINGGQIHGNGANGFHVLGSNDLATHVVFFGNGGKPIANEPGANGGIAPPANLRIGPRRADGTLPLTGTSTGTIELWSGDPSGASAPGFLAAFSTGGDFAYNFPTEPQPGSVFAVSLTNAGQGTSEFEKVAVPQDIVSPDVTFSRALDTNNVRVDFTEPLDPASVQPTDFALNMAGADRTITGATVAPDGLSVTLASSGWRAGEAGYLTVNGPGAVTDVAGNAMLSAPRIRVAAAPGDFISPLGGRLAVTPKTICLTHGKGCRHTGMTITFTTTEAGKATLVIKRSDVTVGKRLYGNVVAGTNTLKWNGRLGSRKLRAGRYRLLMYVQDQVGNITDQPPIVLFSVKRVSK
jgi:hypothetical protein